MTVLIRGKRSQQAIARSRARGDREPGARGRLAQRAGRLVPAAALASASRSAEARPAAPSGRRAGPAAQDQALYTCGCGYVFSHEVSTSVSCPHCGDTQAW